MSAHLTNGVVPKIAVSSATNSATNSTPNPTPAAGAAPAPSAQPAAVTPTTSMPLLPKAISSAFNLAASTVMPSRTGLGGTLAAGAVSQLLFPKTGAGRVVEGVIELALENAARAAREEDLRKKNEPPQPSLMAEKEKAEEYARQIKIDGEKIADRERFLRSATAVSLPRPIDRDAGAV